MSLIRIPARLPALAAWALLLLALFGGIAPRAQAAKPKQEAAEPLEIAGRVVVGMDQVFVKDTERGYFLIQGYELARYSGRRIIARVVVVKKGEEYATARLLDYRVSSPDDDSPGAVHVPGKAQTKKSK